MDEYLIELARKYTLAKFIRISADELDFDLVGSPTILAYQGGILIANLVRITDEVGARFDIEAVEDVLLRYTREGMFTKENNSCHIYLYT